jgi:hypothetical protein
MVRLYILIFRFVSFHLNRMISPTLVFSCRIRVFFPALRDQPTNPAERSSKLSHRSIRKPDSIGMFFNFLILLFSSVFPLINPGGISVRLNQVSCLALLDQPAKPAERSSKLSHRSIRKPDSIGVMFISFSVLSFCCSVGTLCAFSLSRRSLIPCLAFRDQPAIPAGSSSNLSQCKIRMRDSMS